MDNVLKLLTSNLAICIYEGLILGVVFAQIAANNSYTDIKIVFIYDEKDSSNLNQWDFVKWFPHVWSEDKKMRFVASNKQEAGDVFYNLTKTFRQREG